VNANGGALSGATSSASTRIKKYSPIILHNFDAIVATVSNEYLPAQIDSDASGAFQF